MRQKFIFATAITVCLALALAPAMANERTVDRNGDRTKAGKARGSDERPDVEQSAMVQFVPLFEPRISGIGTTNKAAGMLAAATKQDGNEAISSLTRILGMELPESAEADKILAETHRRLGDLYEGAPSKQVVLYGIALQHAADPGMRARLEQNIAALGGDVFALSFGDHDRPGADNSTRDAGPDDTCLGAVATGADVGAPYSEVMSITPSGDHNWRSFTNAGGASDGWAVRIETISDNPGTFEDDTDLGLWNDCPENGGTVLAFGDDKPGDFTSLIQTECELGAGTYYVEVGGFFDTATPDNFTLEIEVTDTCTLPVADDFEPDDARAEANDIGHPTSTPAHANGWGRAKKDIQAHSIFPAGDRDHTIFSLTRDELVRMSTKGQHPTFFNDFAETDPLDNPDTVLELYYENEPDYGGRCNQPDDGFLPICFTDADCPDPLNNPIPGFPPCIPLRFFNFLTPFGLENPLAFNDDRGGGDFGSELTVCLPRTNGQGTTLVDGGDWLLRASPFSPSGTFDYEVQVKNEVTCLYESENNGCLSSSEDCSPNPYVFGTEVHAQSEFSATNPFSDADVYRWDVDEDSLVIFETHSFDSFFADTFFQLFVGPDDNGDFFDTGISDDDGGAGYLSALQILVPPASDLLGNTTADADYLLNVFATRIQPNFPYSLVGTVGALPELETEPNDTCATANSIELGETVSASIDPECDFDSFKFTLVGDTFITLETPAGGDTALQLYDCSDDSVLACDDDSGTGLLSKLDGCLPAGDYCAQVRAFSGAAIFAYDISLSGTAGCTPTDPPSISGDGAFTCLDFDTCP